MTEILQDIRALKDGPAFDAFAQALWAKEAAVMVGAGFSRTCVREPDVPVPPLWGDFAGRMEMSLGYRPGNGPDPLRLAQEYQAQHGEDGLDRLIRELVVDERWEPSDIHQQLMEFPWVDVLTTNWDTLLERTAPKAPDRIYSRVQTIHDIARTRAPRIVKLHGSLPSTKPFVFTEDEFRRYPQDFAPFVNLAQQVMLENELCLIGFSGADPNFLAWSGWVRDTLAVSARRIRLVGVLNLTPAARSLLEQRNVTPIDLAPLVKDEPPSQKHQKALELFFMGLVDAKPPSPFEWVLSSDRFVVPPDAEDANKATRQAVVETWASDRHAYPGWIVPPQDQCHALSYSRPTLRADEEDPSYHLKFAAEHIWRCAISGRVVWRHDVVEADKYFGAVQSLSASERTDLCVNAAKHWRMFQAWEHWSKWMSRLADAPGEEARLWHAYETGWKAVFDWDDDALDAAIDKMTSQAPVWCIRRAALNSMRFAFREAALDYQTALLAIRQKLRAAPKSAWLISLEAWASLFHRVTYSALHDDFSALGDQDTDETRLRYTGAKADPWDEISRQDRLAVERTERNRTDSEEWALSFTPGRYRPGGVRRLGGEDECPFYGLLDLIERTGAPERSIHGNLFSTRIVSAYLALKDPDEDDLMTFLARYRGTDIKILDRILPRMRVALIRQDSIDFWVENIVKRIDRMLDLSGVRRHDDHVRFLLALLARLVIRIDDHKALEIFQWCLRTLNVPNLWWTCISECGDVLSATIEVMGSDQRQTALPLALTLKLPMEAKVKGIEREWPELIDEFSANDLNWLQILPAVSNRIDTLIALAKTSDRLDRTRALTRLMRLHNAGKLTEQQNAKLSDAIWGSCGDSGWPTDHDLYPWVFLDLPGHEQAQDLFRTSFLDTVASEKLTQYSLLNLRFGLSKLDKLPDCNELLQCIHACVAWRPEPNDSAEARYSPFEDINPDLETTKEVGYILSNALLPAFDQIDTDSDLGNTLSKIPDLDHIPTLAATAYQLYRLFPHKQNDAIELLRSAVASRDPARVYPAFEAIKQFVDSAIEGAVIPNEVVETLLHIAEQRLQPGLSNALGQLGRLVQNGKLAESASARLARAIPLVVEEYRYDQKSLDVPSMAELPYVRRFVGRLAAFLTDNYPHLENLHQDLRDDPLPEVRKVFSV